MRRFTAVIGGGFVALMVGSIAVAEDPGASSTVTITVEAQPRTISVSGSPALTVEAGATATREVVRDDAARISFTNPNGNGTAKIEATRDTSVDLESLRLFLVVGTSPDYSVGECEWTGAFGTGIGCPVVLGIGAGATHADVPVEVSLSGDAGSTRAMSTAITFVILDA